MSNLFKYISAEWRDLKQAEVDAKDAFFVAFCKKNILLQEEGEITIQDASYNMCGACIMFFHELMPRFEKIMDIVCRLELPNSGHGRMISDWEILKGIVKEYEGNRITVTHR